jgi:aryl-alcohol dehydrogenase-like predicted oxidoreductase
LRSRAHELLDRAYGAGIRYFDVARSYGRAEEFLAQWLRARPEATDVVVGSKWGYTYTAGWRIDAEVAEVKDHSVAAFDRQLGETRALLGDRLDLYQIHSITPDSPALTDTVLHRRLADLAASGVVIGVSASGPSQAAAIRSALGVEVDGRPLFRSVQATWNLLEPSAGRALAEAHDAGCLVIVKEALANGRLAADDVGALAAALSQPWAGIVLSGAATVDQLTSNLRAETLVRASATGPAAASAPDPPTASAPGPATAPAAAPEPGPAAAPEPEPPDVYWDKRSRLPWT